IDSKEEHEEKRKCDHAIRQSEQIRVEEIAGAEEEVIPKRVDEHDRTEQSESGGSPRRGRQQKEPAENGETDHVIEDADDHPAPERNGIRGQTKTGETLLDAASREETFQRRAERADRKRIDDRAKHRSPLLQQQGHHEKQNAGRRDVPSERAKQRKTRDRCGNVGDPSPKIEMRAENSERV